MICKALKDVSRKDWSQTVHNGLLEIASESRILVNEAKKSRVETDSKRNGGVLRTFEAVRVPKLRVLIV
jgi:hypothetical protein